MILRLVHLSFNPEFSEEFVKVFEEAKPKIKAQPGCYQVNLLRDVNDPNVFFTQSKWDSESDLNTYRETELFKSTWARIKPHFSEKAQAWSTKVI